MNIFRNPLDEPITSRKAFGIVVYLVLALISIWATSESIQSSFKVPIGVSYLLGIAFIITMALFLGVIKQIIEDRRVSILKLILVILTFSLLWVVSLATNSHKLFTQLKIEDIRKNELDIATIELENIENNSLSIGSQVVDDYVHFVNSRIQDYRKEVSNVGNCGHGPVADTLMGKVQRSMPGSVFSIPSGRFRTNRDCRLLANEMANSMTNELNSRVSLMRDKLRALSECDDENKRETIIENLKSQNSFLADFKSLDLKEVLSEAHEYYNQLYQCYNDGLIQSIGSVTEFSKAREFKGKLKLPVPSIDLEKISALIPFVRNHPKDNPGSYSNSLLLSMAIAFILDLAAFIIYYFVILKES